MQHASSIAAGFTLTFYPIVKAYTLGQLQVWINGLFAVALLCWALGWKSFSGFLVGLTCLMKPHYGLFLAWALLRAEWRFMAVCAATVAAGLGAAVLVFGFANHIDYLRVVSFLGERGEAYYPNHSINGLLNRIMSIADPEQYKNLEFVAGHFPPFNPWVYGLTVSSSAAILAAALLHRSTTGDPARLYDFCLMALSCTMASPIAWEHHYGILLPIFAVLVVAVAPKPLPLGLLAAAYALASVYIPATHAAGIHTAQLRAIVSAVCRADRAGAAALAAVGGRRRRPDTQKGLHRWSPSFALPAIRGKTDAALISSLLGNRRVRTELHRRVVALLSPASDDSNHRTKQRHSHEFLGHRNSPSTGWIGPPGPNLHATSCSRSVCTRNQSVRDLNSLPPLSTERPPVHARLIDSPVPPRIGSTRDRTGRALNASAMFTRRELQSERRRSS